MPLLQRLLDHDSPLSSTARRHRTAMWAFALGAVAALLLALAGFTGRGPAALGMAGTVLTFTSLGLAGHHGLKVRRQLLDERERAARQALTVMLAARLRDRDEAELREAVRRGGPAGHAAQLILQGREERAARTG